MYKFIRNHILTILNGFEKEVERTSNRVAFDRYLSDYFRTHKSVGSNERSEISEKVYALLRYSVLLDYMVKGDRAWDKKLEAIFTPYFYEAKDRDSKIPMWAKCSQNKELFKLLAERYGETKAFELSEVMNHRAPLTLRINPLKISRENFLNKWKNMSVVPTEHSPYGVRIIQKKQYNLLETEEFKNGWFEIQDQGSQLAALQVKAQPGDLILDYCAGSGGKSLAIAHLLHNRGQIFMHDTNPKALTKAKQRMERAGINNVQFHRDESKLEVNIKRKIDWLILDVPCTGTGTLRRNPDIKLKFSMEWLRYNIRLQETIVEKSLKYLKKDGKIVYITCSLLPQQNQEQIRHFASKYGLKLVDNKVLSLLPQPDGMDGFFAATLSL